MLLIFVSDTNISVMKYRTFRIMVARGWTKVLYTLSLLLLPSVVHSQDTKVTFKYKDQGTIRSMRVMYGVMVPDTDDSPKVPLLTVNNFPCPYDTVAARSFNFKTDGKDFEKMAGLIGMNAADIDSISVLDNSELSTAIWGVRGKNGVINVYTKGYDPKTAQPWVPDQIVIDSTLAGRTVVYGPPTVMGKDGEVKPVGKARLAWWRYRHKVRSIFH